MDSYNVIISPKALSQLNEYISYIQFTLLNEDAAKRVWADAKETKEELTLVAGSLPLCPSDALSSLGYHQISFRHHNYLMIYRIDGLTVYVEAIYHQLQDYAHLFIEDLQE